MQKCVGDNNFSPLAHRSLYFVTQSHVTAVELKIFLKTKEESEVLYLKFEDNLIYME
jgi:hypothetical protein